MLKPISGKKSLTLTHMKVMPLLAGFGHFIE